MSSSQKINPPIDVVATDTQAVVAGSTTIMEIKDRAISRKREYKRIRGSTMMMMVRSSLNRVSVGVDVVGTTKIEIDRQGMEISGMISPNPSGVGRAIDVVKNLLSNQSKQPDP